MSYIEKSLSDGERIVTLFKLHWMVWIEAWLMVLLIVTIPFALLRFLVLKGKEFGVTNKRVIYKSGVIGRRTQEMKLSSIETVEIRQGIFRRIFGYGNIVVTGRGTSDLLLASMVDPLEVKKAIESINPN